MAGRKNKLRADYFSHDAKRGRTLRVLQSQFGNDGYAVWFKLLERLCDTDGHSIDTKDKHEWLDLCAYFDVSSELAEKVLDMLSDLKAIDSELWENDRIIWSDGLILRLATLYNRRNSAVIKPISVNINLKDTGQKPQSKVKESKVKKSIEKEKRILKDWDSNFSDFFPRPWIEDELFWETWESFVAERKVALKTPLTENGAKSIVADLLILDRTTARLMVKQSIDNGWKGVFPLNRNNGKNQGSEKEIETRDIENTISKILETIPVCQMENELNSLYWKHEDLIKSLDKERKEEITREFQARRKAIQTTNKPQIGTTTGQTMDNLIPDKGMNEKSPEKG
jgi:hypothetical protein